MDVLFDIEILTCFENITICLKGNRKMFWHSFVTHRYNLSQKLFHPIDSDNSKRNNYAKEETLLMYMVHWSNSTKSHSRHGELSDVAVVPQGLSLPRIPDRHLEADRPFSALPLDHPHHHPPPPVRLHHALHLLICEAIDDAYDETL